MHICHINLANGYRGGERQTELLIRALAEGGLTQSLICRRGAPLSERLADLHALQIRGIDKPFTGRWRQLGGDVVHAHENQGAHLAHVGRRLGGRPYLITRRIAKRPGTSFVTRDMYRQASHVVGVCRAVEEVLRAYEPRIKSTTIYSVRSELAVNPDRVAVLHERFAGRRVILNVAALAMGQKGQQHLLAAARSLSGRHPDLAFVFCGGGPDEAALRALAADLDNVHFEGFVDNVGDYLAAADLFVLPSLWEGLGTISLDAMASGLPVIASAVDGLPEIVRDGETGLLVPPADDGALAAAIERLLAEPDLAKQLGEAGRVLSRDFTPARMAEQYERLYERAPA